MAKSRRTKTTSRRKSRAPAPAPEPVPAIVTPSVDPAPTTPAFVLRGPQIEAPEPSALAPARPGDAEPSVKIRVTAEFRPASRGIAPEQQVRVAADDVLEIEFADGMRVWMRGDEYRERFGKQAPRGAVDAALDVPMSLPMSAEGGSTRGIAGWVLKSLKVLGVDVQARTALALAQTVETRKGLRRPGPGLFQCPTETGAFQLLEKKVPTTAPDQKPYLVFLHGTLSSTWGSFGELWAGERSRELQALVSTYGDRILGFEHQTLAVSPIQNAIELAESLPVGAHVHLVSHSRGGLVGELLCRAQARAPRRGGGAATDTSWQPAAAFSDDEIETLGEQGPLLTKLGQALAKSRITVERFVRVACPALGTTLASGRLDRWLSVIGSVASKALPGTPIAEVARDIGDFIAAVVKERTDPKTLPGVEAMMPESPFIKMINWPSARVAGDLYVIAGDLDPDAWWAKLLVWVTDRFYSGDHDLVVNTASMYGGAGRTGAAKASFFEGPAVNHFNYFRNSDSAARLASSVTRGDVTGFEDFEPERVEIARAIEVRDATPRPTVFVLPGIMGSELAVGPERIWFKLTEMLLGGMKRLAIDARNVTPVEPFARYYGDLIRYLASSHRVIPFAYDWRINPVREADRLADHIRQELPAAQSQRLPVRILAHSMGGLVARTMISRHADLWRQMLAIPGARFVMLGTPNGGSHSITELLVARSKTLRQLALLDTKSGIKGLLSVIARFPGVLAMLPVDNREDYFAAATWQSYAQLTGAEWITPVADDLAQARELRSILDRAEFDPQSMFYVAGHARATLCAMRYDSQEKDPDDRIKFDATNRGDGRVTWDTGVPPGVKTWYMDAEHGDLSCDESGFPAIAEILGSGNTARLSLTPPVDRGLADVFPMPRDTDAVYPDEASVQAEMLGAQPARRRRARRRSEPPVQVRAVHGNLAFASFPVAVGHYTGDTIISAERALDRALGGQLSRRLQLGLYPGAVETCAVFVNPQLHAHPLLTPRGALVVGLGAAGMISGAQLTRTFVHGLLEFVTKWPEYMPAAGPDEQQRLGISTLLVGSGMGGVSVTDSVAAFLRAVQQANAILAAAAQPQRIGQVEIVELWRDRALEVVNAFARIEQDEPSLRGVFQFDPELALRKGRRQRAVYEEPPGWWHRIEIVGERTPDSTRKVLRFSAVTRRARSEVRLLAAQRALVDKFVEQAIRTTQHDEALSRTLFELMLPNEFKDASLDEDNIVLLLDDESASYPWELLEDPLQDAGVLARQPFIYRHGVLRQLLTTTFRDHVQPSTSTDVLVVGDPVSSFVELKGAQAEARAVARTLEVSGRFRVSHFDRPSGTQVLNALFDRPYRMLHLAGHGVYRYPSKDGGVVTGMVIGDGMFLTPQEVRQMRRVPELVFMNCCHLGRIAADGAGAGAGTPELNMRTDYNQIAANVAQEFIEMGVRAVIAAGWAVDDEAAATFAQSFYRAMLEGATFGVATSAARKQIFDSFPSVNTWGAYQCYGDPDYRLVQQVAGASKPAQFETPEVAVIYIDNLRADLEIIGDGDPAWFIAELGRLEQRLVQQDWLSRPRCALALGRAYWEALRLEEAIRFYRLALRDDSASLTLEDIEQLANLMTRKAVAARRVARTAAEREAAKTYFADAAELLEWVTTPLAVERLPLDADAKGPASRGAHLTSERLNLLGSLWKRRAWMASDAAETRAAVVKMQTYYQQAADASKGDAYPRFNALMALLVAHWITPSTAKSLREWERVTLPQLRADLAEVTGAVQALAAPGARFWTNVAPIDCELLAMLVEGKVEDGLDSLATDYLASRVLSSRREFDSVADQIDFLARMADAGKQRKVASLLGRLSERLRVATST